MGKRPKGHEHVMRATLLKFQGNRDGIRVLPLNPAWNVVFLNPFQASMRH